MGTRQGALHVGTSGWHYPSWWGPFFPREIRKKDALAYYGGRFLACELNAPFYRTPTLEAVRGWVARTPAEFRFAWKASRFITHWKRLADSSANSLALMESRIAELGEKAGPILFQLPPTSRADPGRLAAFLAMLDRKRSYTFEFRDPSWYAPAVLALLAEHDAALCLSDHADAPAPWEATARFVYIRGHGPSGRYNGSYPDETLAGWAKRIRRWQRENRDVWCFFDNDVKSAAPADAERLKRILPAVFPPENTACDLSEDP